MRIPKTIFACLSILVIFGATNLPRRELAADPPWFPVSSGSPIIFPYVEYNPSTGFNTFLSIVSDVDTTELGENPSVTLYAWNHLGEYRYETPLTLAAGSKSSQWVINVSDLYPEGFKGWMLALPNFGWAEGQAFTYEPYYQKWTDVPAIQDFSILGVDQNKNLVRTADYTPPPEWWLEDPILTDFDPSLLRSTIIFPAVTTLGSADTTLVVTNTFNARAVAERCIKFALYDLEGNLVQTAYRNLTYDAAPGHKVTEMFKESMETLFPGFEGIGWVLALVNVPHAHGTAFCTPLFGTNPWAGHAAAIDNNIYDAGETICRVKDPEGDHTALVFPYVNVNEPVETTLTISNTFDATDAYPDKKITFYLYDKNGNRVAEWGIALVADNEVSEMWCDNVLNLFPNAGDMLEDGVGWVLAIVDIPDAHGVCCITTPNGICAAASAIVDNGIVEVDAGGRIRRGDSLPLGNKTRWSAPFVSHDAIATTTMITVNTQDATMLSPDSKVYYYFWEANATVDPPVNNYVSLQADGHISQMDIRSTTDLFGLNPLPQPGSMFIDVEVPQAHYALVHVIAEDWVMCSG